MASKQIDPAVFTPEQWAAVEAFADAQARANFAYQQDLPVQQVARTWIGIGDFVWAVMQVIAVVFWVAVIVAVVVHTSH